jgi:hypothetical protein
LIAVWKDLGPVLPAAELAMISDKPSLAIGELTDSQVVGRNRAGGASNVEAYQHWIEGSQQPLDIDFSDANVSSASQELRPQRFLV